MRMATSLSVTSARIVCWTSLVGAVAAINYAAYGKAHATGEEIYSYTSFADGAVFYAVILGNVVRDLRGEVC